MSRQTLALDELLSREVRDREGRSVGRIEEIRATPNVDGLLVYQYDLGPAALLERLAVSLRAFPPLRWLGRAREHRGYCVPWEKMDLSDPLHPRVTCTREELPRLTE